jgi:hypothetical protein
VKGNPGTILPEKTKFAEGFGKDERGGNASPGEDPANLWMPGKQVRSRTIMLAGFDVFANY